jgi:hypothetical protein
VTALCDLVTETNKYLTTAGATPALYLLERIAMFITRILRVFGVVEGDDAIGFPLSEGGSNREETLRPILDAFRDYRQVSEPHFHCCILGWDSCARFTALSLRLPWETISNAIALTPSDLPTTTAPVTPEPGC